MKYKPCCGRRCMIIECDIRDNGGCYCLCRLHDEMNNLQSIIDGETLYDGIGMQYIPNENYREKIFNKWSSEKKETYENFRKQAPNLLEKVKDKIKEYEIQSQS